MTTNIEAFDNTRLTEFKSCPRKYYFRHVMGWVPDKRRTPLIFGSAWHKAMEEVWADTCVHRVRDKGQVLRGGLKAFMTEWQAHGMPEVLSYDEEQNFAPRTPGVAHEMLANYIDKRWLMMISPETELLHVEKSFKVALNPERTRFYVGLIDKIIMQRGRIYSIEHKTTTAYRKGGPFRDIFTDSFSPNSQVDGYAFALHILFPGRVGGIWVDAALVHKSEDGVMIIPVERQREQLDGWLWETHYWISNIAQNMTLLADVKPEDRYMHAFPKQTGNCFNFNAACEYIDLCKAWSNPVGKPMPLGFREEPWNPLDRVNAQTLEDIEEVAS